MKNTKLKEGMGSVNVDTQYDVSRIRKLAGLANSSTATGIAYANVLEAEFDLDRIKKLAGLGSGAKGDGMESPLTHGGNEKGEYMKKHNIEPGTEAWFKLWFSRPKLTGERPYGS